MLKEYIQGVRSLSIIGMCKNAGKTTVRSISFSRARESNPSTSVSLTGTHSA